MYFFTNLCINYEGEIGKYDLLEATLKGECPVWLRVEEMTETTQHSVMYDKEEIRKLVELNIAGILTIQVALYVNPQVMTGMKLKWSTHYEKLDGLLMYKYASKSARVSSIYDESKCKYSKVMDPKYVTETFYMNDGTNETRCIEIV